MGLFGDCLGLSRSWNYRNPGLLGVARTLRTGLLALLRTERSDATNGTKGIATTERADATDGS